MGLIFVLLFYLSIPFIMLFLVWICKWIWIVLSLALGDSESIYLIKDSTCDKKYGTLTEYLDYVFMGPPDNQKRPPPHDRNSNAPPHDHNSNAPSWRRYRY